MSKTRWILVCAAIAYLMALGPLTINSVSIDTQQVAAETQRREVDWCCLAGLSRCTIPPHQQS